MWKCRETLELLWSFWGAASGLLLEGGGDLHGFVSFGKIPQAA